MFTLGMRMRGVKSKYTLRWEDAKHAALTLPTCDLAA